MPLTAPVAGEGKRTGAVRGGRMDFRGRKYERGSNWSDPEVMELLQLWADKSVQLELESCLRNQHVFNRIAEVLRDKGIHRTGDQCREKIKKMKLEYRKIKDSNKGTRGGRTWKFYEVMDRVLTSRPSIAYDPMMGNVVTQPELPGALVESYHHHFTPPNLPFGHSQHPSELMEIKCEQVDSDEQEPTPEPPIPMTYQPTSPKDQQAEHCFLERGQNDSPLSRAEIPIETSMSPSGFSDPNLASSSSQLPSEGPQPDFPTVHRLRRKWKGLRIRDPVDELLLKVLTSQQAMEERFLHLEEQRVQLEQRRLEVERDHEFRMFSIFAQMLNILKQGSGASPGPAAPMSWQGFGLAPEDPKRSRTPQGPEQTFPVFYGLSNPGTRHLQGSPYLSNRGNDIKFKSGINDEGNAAYYADKYDEDKNPNGIINFGISENKLCFDLLSKRLSQSDMHHIEPSLLQYQDWRGHMFLREEMARFLTYYCKSPNPLKPENVILFNGCGSVFSALATVLCDSGEALMIPTPFYGGIVNNTYLYGNVQLVYAHLDSKITETNTRPFQLTVEKLEMALQRARSEGVHIKGLILINPQNPLGDVYSQGELLEYLEFAKRHELHIILDEIYMLSVFDESATFHSVLSMDRLPDPQRTHVMWGTSKDFGISGIRLGALYTENRDVAAAVANLCYFHGISGIIQYQIAQLLRDHDWINQVYLPTNQSRLKAAHTYITDELKTLGIPFLNRNSGLYVWIDLRRYLHTGTFEEELLLFRRFLGNKVLLHCGKSFLCFEPGWFRLVFTDKIHRLQLGMQRFRQVLEQQTQELQQKLSLPRQPWGQEGQADGPEESVFLPIQQGPTNGVKTRDLIGLLQQQMCSSAWLQKGSLEQLTQEQPGALDVLNQLVSKQ
ncbi:1-aminocyclopropane-1-carboxylate synthase-like protein 1 [Sarcophilus harrisii]|uniref:1-aminocyclopropane-1-carboxylate synthase-like protein 1 n=1 Tax=Sarcophilus harrisii TaxID=9305 RepID=UPI000273C6C0|nr:1-aminocyclopropane-1-carboxylate synthase-like protein 1 [Sarcophilus harrisii]